MRCLLLVAMTLVLNSCGNGNSKNNSDGNNLVPVQPNIDEKVHDTKDVKHDDIAALGFTDDEKTELKTLSYRSAKDLKPEDKIKVINILWQHVLRSKTLTVAKQVCHIQTLEGDHPCASIQKMCSEKLDKFTDESYHNVITTSEQTIRGIIQRTVDETHLNAEDIEIVFEFFNEIVRVTSKFNCDTPSKDIENFGNEIDSAVIKKHGKDKFEKMEFVAQRYLAPFLFPVER